ncbi:MAG: hypothetical protein BWY34_00278 [Parcubacteria group bacterium ADurb.Bin247]|jgi:hypothetical protein|nr:MAG: hypothetical protein BWY34_00278 [Parcubacteria group bacterium ADurb.Bin247]
MFNKKLKEYKKQEEINEEIKNTPMPMKTIILRQIQC